MIESTATFVTNPRTPDTLCGLHPRHHLPWRTFCIIHRIGSLCRGFLSLSCLLISVILHLRNKALAVEDRLCPTKIWLYELKPGEQQLYRNSRILSFHLVVMHTPSCPIYPYSDPSPYFPESDEPSFVPRYFLEDVQAENVRRRETTTDKDAPSQDYIECECGEAVLLSEFDGHVQLHSAESADMAVDTSQLPEGVTLCSPQQRIAWPPTASPLQPVDLNAIPAVHDVADTLGHNHGTRPSKVTHDLHHHKHDKQHHTVKEWIDLLLGSHASPTRTKGNATQPKGARRLGVSHGKFPAQGCGLTFSTESGARPLCS